MCTAWGEQGRDSLGPAAPPEPLWSPDSCAAGLCSALLSSAGGSGGGRAAPALLREAEGEVVGWLVGAVPAVHHAHAVVPSAARRVPRSCAPSATPSHPPETFGASTYEGRSRRAALGSAQRTHGERNDQEKRKEKQTNKQTKRRFKNVRKQNQRLQTRTRGRGSSESPGSHLQSPSAAGEADPVVVQPLFYSSVPHPPRLGALLLQTVL